MGVCQTDAESADINFTSGHEFSSRPLRILSEYSLMTFFITSQIQNITFKLKVNWANGFLRVIYKVPLIVGSLDV